MSYVEVGKNDAGEYEVIRTITTLTNQRSKITGMTIGNVTSLDAAGRLLHGFWLMDDVYIGTGEFKEFDHKDVNFDDVEGKVTNTYTYVLMDLNIIKDEMKNRVRSYRSQLSQSVYKKGDNEFDISVDGRTELQGMVLEVLLDSTIQQVSIRLPSGVDVTMTPDEVKSLHLEISLYRDGLFEQEEKIIADIDSAPDYDTVRSVSKWGDQVL